MNRHKITTARRVGEVSSKYGYQPELFERDLEQHAAESEARGHPPGPRDKTASEKLWA